MFTIIQITFFMDNKFIALYEPKLTVNPTFYIQTDNFEIAESLGNKLLEKEHNPEDYYKTVMALCTVHAIE